MGGEGFMDPKEIQELSCLLFPFSKQANSGLNLPYCMQIVVVLFKKTKL